jgi:hypothetical protein
MATVLLGLACGEAPLGGDEGLRRKGLKSQALQAMAAGQWSPTGPLATARWYHTATLLRDGKVLVAGRGDAQ